MNIVSTDIIEAILEAAFKAMLLEYQKAGAPVSKAYAQGYLTAINDLSRNLKTALETADLDNPELNLAITITSFSGQDRSIPDEPET